MFKVRVNTFASFRDLAMVCVIVMLSAQMRAEEVNIEPPSSCSFYGNFEQRKFLKGLDMPVESSGAFFYHCQHGVIWKTLLPVTETLVLNSEGKGSKVEENQVAPLKSGRGKLLGQLINGLIGADPEFINKNFDVKHGKLGAPAVESQENAQRQRHVLSPKRRSFRRALTRIELETPVVDINSQDGAENMELVTISLLDRHQQWTHIVSSKKVDYPPAGDGGGLAQCMASTIFSLRECELLEQREAS